ncbi:hypothetical protein N431DRAFT_550006 [Stipitochalara longipes BDJ]|nr:hypothetical protein N431DRAFT_550006 [Stipitochalara longipes BDJ]
MAPVNASLISAFPPPLGVTANFVNPPSIAWHLYAFSLPFTGAATLFVALRLYARAYVLRFLGLDDLFLVIALIFAWAFAIPYGYGVDLWNLTRDEVITFLKLDLGAFTTYYLGTLFVKLSILLFYLRINPDRTFRRLAYAIGAFEITYIALSIGIQIFGCSPVARSWDFYIPGSCVNKIDFFYVEAVFNIVTDFATLLLPIRMCVRLQLPTKQRWMLGLTFAVGSFACIVSIVRLVTLLPAFHSINFTVLKVNIAAWCEVEINTGIICSSLPCLKPILNRHFPSLMKNNSSVAVLSGNVMGHVRGDSGGNEEGWKEVRVPKIDALEGDSGGAREGEQERAAEEIRGRIRGWSVSEKKEMGMGVVSEVSVDGSAIAERSSVGSEDGILGGFSFGLERKKSTKEMGGISKTVAYDVKYESP